MRTIFPPISDEVRSHIPTAQAAFYLMNEGQTLRAKLCRGELPKHLEPKKIGGRLGWPVEGIKKELRGE